MKSLAIKPEVSTSPGNSKNKKYYPSASFDTKSIPELKDAKDGEHHHILIKFKKTGSNTDNNNTRVHGDMVAAEYKGKAKASNDEPGAVDTDNESKDY